MPKNKRDSQLIQAIENPPRHRKHPVTFEDTDTFEFLYDDEIFNLHKTMENNLNRKTSKRNDQ